MDLRVLALISASGSGKTRSLLELLCLRFGLLLVGNTRGNGGAADFARVVDRGKAGTDHGVFRRQVAACVLARLLVLQHACARGWTPAQFLNIQLFDHGLFRKIQLRLETASFADLDEAVLELLSRLNVTGLPSLPIIMDEAQALLPDTPSGESLYQVATGMMAAYTNSVAAACVIVSGTSFVLKDMEPDTSSGLLTFSQALPTMAPSPLTPDNVTGIVRKVLGSEPPAAVGKLLHGRGRFVMTFLRVLLRMEMADAACGVVPRARTQPASGDARASKRPRLPASGSAAGARVGAGAGAASARDVAVPGYVGGSGDGEVSVAKLDPRKWDATVWLDHLANAEREILFGGLECLTRAVPRFTADDWVMTALGQAAVAAALGAEHTFVRREPSEDSWLLQLGLASIRSIDSDGVPEVVVYEPLVWRAIQVVALEQHTDAFAKLLSATMELAYAASASALGFATSSSSQVGG